MTLAIIEFLIAIGLSSYFTYLICVNIAWFYFAFGILFIIPTYLALFGLFCLFLVIWGIFINKKKEVKKPNRFYYWVLQQTDTWVVILSLTHVHVHGKENLPKENYLLINNHISNFDQMVLIEKFSKDPLICVTKPENMNFPIAGPFIHKTGFIPINREDPRKAIPSIKKAASVITNKEGNICISPEGTRNKTQEPLLPFHPGSFKIAYLAKCPIVVCSLKGTKDIHKNFPLKHTHVDIDILKVLPYEEYKDMSTSEVAAYTRNLILEDLSNNKGARTR